MWVTELHYAHESDFVCGGSREGMNDEEQFERERLLAKEAERKNAAVEQNKASTEQSTRRHTAPSVLHSNIKGASKKNDGRKEVTLAMSNFASYDEVHHLPIGRKTRHVRLGLLAEAHIGRGV